VQGTDFKHQCHRKGKQNKTTNTKNKATLLVLAQVIEVLSDNHEYPNLNSNITKKKEKFLAIAGKCLMTAYNFIFIIRTMKIAIILFI
jgi:hypothetical protein